MQTKEGEIFNEELCDPTVLARPTGKLLAVGTVGACPCGCGRPAGVIVDTPQGAVVMTSWRKVGRGMACRGVAWRGVVWQGPQWGGKAEAMQYEFTLKGTMPLLMHNDNIMAADEITAWQKDPKNKSVSVPGDDRSPPWTWFSYLYHDEENLVIPTECIMAMLKNAGAKISAKRGSFKAMTQSGLLMATDFCAFTNGGKPIKLADIHRFKEAAFAKHVASARNLGFDLHVKRAKIGQKKHVRVRPIFHAWQVVGCIEVTEPAITEAVLEQLFEIAGRLVGLGDWRPSSPSSPGPYGMFTATLKQVTGKGRKAS